MKFLHLPSEFELDTSVLNLDDSWTTAVLLNTKILIKRTLNFYLKKR